MVELAAIPFRAFVERDLGRAVAERERHRGDPRGEIVGFQVRHQAGVVAGIGLERDDLWREPLDGEHDAVEAGVGADIEEDVDGPPARQRGQVLELRLLPHAEMGDALVDEIGRVHEETRALRAHDMRDDAQPPQRPGIELAGGSFDRADRVAKIAGRGHGRARTSGLRC